MSEASIAAKVQLIAQDYGESFTARVVGNGSLARYELPVSNVDPTTIVAYIEGTPNVPLTPGTAGALTTNQYYLDARPGTIELWAPLASGKALVVSGQGQYITLPDDMSAIIEIAFDMQTNGRYPAPTMDTLSATEEYLVALLAVREMLWAELVAAAQEVDINTPEGMHIPEGQRYQQLMGILDRLDAHYKELSAITGLGLYAIEMFTLRRVSRTTNRLVPLYVPQEFDDHNPPLRVIPPINAGGPISPNSPGI